MVMCGEYVYMSVRYCVCMAIGHVYTCDTFVVSVSLMSVSVVHVCVSVGGICLCVFPAGCGLSALCVDLCSSMLCDMSACVWDVLCICHVLCVYIRVFLCL